MLGWFNCKFNDDLIKSLETSYSIRMSYNDDDNNSVKPLPSPTYSNVKFEQNWSDWTKNIEGDWGIDNKLIIWFQLESVVAGWGEIIPLFKTGTFDTSAGPNPSTFSNFGAGVMFLPSGLAYYEQMPSSLIPSYSPNKL